MELWSDVTTIEYKCPPHTIKCSKATTTRFSIFTQLDNLEPIFPLIDEVLMSAPTHPRETKDASFGISGTQSPPVGGSGSEKPLGIASVDHDVDAGFVSDAEQRKR